jgi:hypothetical protein
MANDMANWLPILSYLVFWAVAMQAILARARLVRPLCARCGRPLESRFQGEKTCTCSRQ